MCVCVRVWCTCARKEEVKLNVVKTNRVLHTHLFDLVIPDLLVHKLKESARKNWTINTKQNIHLTTNE